MITRETKKTIIFDAILVVSLLLVALSAFLIYYFVFFKGQDEPTAEAVVVVKLGDEVVAEYPLSDDGEYSPTDTNKIRIEDGKVWMIYSTCPGYQDCVQKGKVSLVGDKIICLPNRVSVFIEER